MKTLLVMALHPELADSIRAGLNPEMYRILHRTGLEEAEGLLAQGFVDACVVDIELTNMQVVWLLEKVRRRAPRLPLIVYAGARQWEYEEEAYLQGANHVLIKPVRPKLLATLLERLWTAPAAAPAYRYVATGPAPAVSQAPVLAASNASAPRVLRDFSGILSHSLNTEGMLRQFLLLMRDLLSINRAAIFLRQPFANLGGASMLSEGRRMRAVCAVGLSPGLLEHFELSFESGVGGQVFRLGRIVRRNEPEMSQDAEVQKEFELLGTQVAVPILDREAVLGVAVFDGRITGEPLVNSELEMIFHLLEQLGLAIRNIWLHDQLSQNHEMMTDILRELNSGCVVVSRDLAILHANKSARRFFPPARSGELEFSDLPQAVGAKVYQVLRTGAVISNFKFEPPDAPGKLFSLNIIPFQRAQADPPRSALLIADDLTKGEQLQKLEVETSNLRLVRHMADRLTNEIGNALVPLSVHQQVLAEKLKGGKADSEFLKMMNRELAESVRRVTRLANQLRFLARETPLAAETFPLGPVLEEAYQEARKHQHTKAADLTIENDSRGVVCKGDRNALRHAISEVMLNALQANPDDAQVGVRLSANPGGNGAALAQIELQDNGPGFTPEALTKASTPFWTTKVVGLGLGLAVAKRILEVHHGRIDLEPPSAKKGGRVRISLPLNPEGHK